MGRVLVHAVLGPGAAALIALCAIASARAQPATAGDEERTQQAKQRFEQGVADYDAGRYEQALANFQEAHRLRPHPLVNVNIANCYDKLGKPLLAIFHFERFVEGKAGTPAQQAEVDSALARLRKQVGALVLRVAPDGARVIVDAEQQRRAPILEPIQLQAGEHHLEVQLEGYQTVERTVIVSGGVRSELDISLERTPAPLPPVLELTAIGPATAPPPAAADLAPPAPRPTTLPAPAAATAPAPPPARRGAKTGAWIVGGVTAALLVTGTVSGLMALDAASDFDASRDRLNATTRPIDRVALYDEAAAAHDRAETLALTTDILLGATLVGAAVTTLLFLAKDEEPTERPPQPQPPSQRTAPRQSDTGALLPF